MWFHSKELLYLFSHSTCDFDNPTWCDRRLNRSNVTKNVCLYWQMQLFSGADPRHLLESIKKMCYFHNVGEASSPVFCTDSSPLQLGVVTAFFFGNRLFYFQTNRERKIDNKKMASFYSVCMFVYVCIYVFVCLFVCWRSTDVIV